ncbi:MAG: hypothetical protein ACHQYQ_09230 [Bacteriovoracales bacterium]
MANETMEQELERLRSENEKLKSQKTKGLTFKVSQKGALSVYGMGRFPVTLYKEQWLRLMDKKEEILEFISENEDQLTTKD